jgi:hypothetical protein
VAWEILHAGLKCKIEMNFSDICALRINCPKYLVILTSLLQLGIYGATVFQRKESTTVQATNFTDGQATILREYPW